MSKKLNLHHLELLWDKAKSTFIKDAPSDGKQYARQDGDWEKITGGEENQIKVTYAQLKSLRDNSQLVPGTWYRLTDYECVCDLCDNESHKKLSSAGHQFDIIIRADDVNILNEECYAANHEGDTYFSNSNLSKWKLKYTIDNDKFYWGTTENNVLFNHDDGDCLTRAEEYDEPNYLFGIAWRITEHFKKLYDIPEDINIVYSNFDAQIIAGHFVLPYTFLISPSNYYSEELKVWIDILGIKHINNLTGKGIIYYMQDDNNNICNYDFKNILIGFENENYEYKEHEKLLYRSPENDKTDVDFRYAWKLTESGIYWYDKYNQTDIIYTNIEDISNEEEVVFSAIAENEDYIFEHDLICFSIYIEDISLENNEIFGDIEIYTVINYENRYTFNDAHEGLKPLLIRNSDKDDLNYQFGYAYDVTDDFKSMIPELEDVDTLYFEFDNIEDVLNSDYGACYFEPSSENPDTEFPLFIVMDDYNIWNDYTIDIDIENQFLGFIISIYDLKDNSLLFNNCNNNFIDNYYYHFTNTMYGRSIYNIIKYSYECIIENSANSIIKNSGNSGIFDSTYSIIEDGSNTFMNNNSVSSIKGMIDFDISGFYNSNFGIESNINLPLEQLSDYEYYINVFEQELDRLYYILGYNHLYNHITLKFNSGNIVINNLTDEFEYPDLGKVKINVDRFYDEGVVELIPVGGGGGDSEIMIPVVLTEENSGYIDLSDDEIQNIYNILSREPKSCKIFTIFDDVFHYNNIELIYANSLILYSEILRADNTKLSILIGIEENAHYVYWEHLSGGSEEDIIEIPIFVGEEIPGTDPKLVEGIIMLDDDEIYDIYENLLENPNKKVKCIYYLGSDYIIIYNNIKTINIERNNNEWAISISDNFYPTTYELRGAEFIMWMNIAPNNYTCAIYFEGGVYNCPNDDKEYVKTYLGWNELNAVKTINNQSPDENGNIDIDAGTVKSVDNQTPDSSGNVNTNAVKSVDNQTPDSSGNVNTNAVKSVDGILPDENGNVKLNPNYIIIDNTYENMDPATKVTGYPGIKYDNEIRKIRNNTHIYCAHSFHSNTLNIKKLSDIDINYYADGSDASQDIQNYDVFVKLPDFWWKCEELEPNSDKWKLSFDTNEHSDWNKWDGNKLIGKYKAFVENDIAYSRSNKTPSVNFNHVDFKSYARAKGNGYSLIDYESHQIMCLLFYAYYGHLNSQKICGYGTNNNRKTTGRTNIFGMNDTNRDNGNNGSINFWGIENWWGDIYEIFDNIKPTNNNYEINITDINNRVIRTISNIKGSGTLRQMIFGENGDVLSKYSDGDTGNDFHYCDNTPKLITYGDEYFMRSGTKNLDSGGISLFSKDTLARNYIGSRLIYTGNIYII